MDSNRKTALTVGILLIAATATSLLGTAIEGTVLSGTHYLVRITENLTRLSAGGLFELIAAGTSAGIAISLYPVLKRESATLAMGAVVFRAIEAVMYTFGAVSMLSLLKLAADTDRPSFQAIGDSLLAFREEAILAGVFAFVVGSLSYYSVFYRSRLVPGWLSVWGIAGALLMLVACLSALFSRTAVTSYVVLVLPIAVQEMVMAVWLIAKGFSSAAQDSGAVTRDALAATAS